MTHEGKEAFMKAAAEPQFEPKLLKIDGYVEYE